LRHSCRRGRLDVLAPLNDSTKTAKRKRNKRKVKKEIVIFYVTENEREYRIRNKKTCHQSPELVILNKKTTGNKIFPVLFCIGNDMAYTFGKKY